MTTTEQNGLYSDVAVNKQEGTELLTRTPIDGTPFTIIGLPEEGKFFGAIGKYRITEEKATEEEVREEVEPFNWNMVATLIYLLTEKQD